MAIPKFVGEYATGQEESGDREVWHVETATLVGVYETWDALVADFPEFKERHDGNT